MSNRIDQIRYIQGDSPTIDIDKVPLESTIRSIRVSQRTHTSDNKEDNRTGIQLDKEVKESIREEERSSLVDRKEKRVFNEHGIKRSIRSSKGMHSLSVLFILLAEFFERFAYYGIKSMLFVYLSIFFGYSRERSISYVHGFVFLSYLSTLLGGLLSDKVFGKYITIGLFLICYIVGAFFLIGSALIRSGRLLSVGLVLVAGSAGGIKPSISSLGGDQFDKDDVKSISFFFNVFYFSVNASSALALFFMPLLVLRPCLDHDTCFSFGFSFSFISLCLALIVFIGIPVHRLIAMIKKNRTTLWYSTSKSSKLPLTKTTEESDSITDRSEKNRDSRIPDLSSALISKVDMPIRTSSTGILEIIKGILPLSVGWMMYDQQSSTWIYQGRKLNQIVTSLGYSFTISPVQLQVLNAIVLVCILPFFNQITKRILNYLSLSSRSESKMIYGMVFFSLAFLLSSVLEISLVFTKNISILWQIPQIVLLTIGEAFIGTTGLEYSYTMASDNSKALVLSLWYLNMALGNLIVIVLTYLFKFLGLPLANQSLLYLSLGLFTTAYMSVPNLTH
ncbi:hypothetical protein NEOKW01_0699 [Nematocida sp. AWRm80]|nr:hypothetical protein NEOKW01_0699 [Nematocida sp. AWRm80]